MTAVGQRSFEELGTPLYDVTFCVLDLETTGGSPGTDAITEIGAVKYRGGELIGTYHTLVNPGSAIPAFITVLTGISQSMVVTAPPLAAVLPSFLEFVGDSVVVGHNVRFDLGFLRRAAATLGYPNLDNPFVDTAALARRLIRSEVRNLRLQTLAWYFRSPVEPIHRALDDARATAHVLFGLLERAGSLGVTGLEDLLALPTARGSSFYRKIGLADGLPRRPGVYLFKNADGHVIYIGKASNLRVRVRSYFYGDERRTIGNLLRELANIDYHVCENVLEAEVTELRLIHAHRPRYNRRSLPPRRARWLKLTREPFPRLSMAFSPAQEGMLSLGPFRSKNSVELAMTAIWDALPIRRCTGKAGGRTARCGPAQLGVALCPCAGDLERATYDQVIERLQTAVELDPALLLDPLREKMRELAECGRYEEAAWLRDRHRALARALERHRICSALATAGLVELEGVNGESVLIDGGRLVATWNGNGHRPLWSVSEPNSTRVPPTVAAADEAELIWKWITSGSFRLVDVSGTLALPASKVERL